MFLTNTNGNARADILNLMRAATTLHPSVIRPGVEIDGRFSHRLGALAAANGIAPGKVHDAEAEPADNACSDKGRYQPKRRERALLS